MKPSEQEYMKWLHYGANMGFFSSAHVCFFFIFHAVFRVPLQNVKDSIKGGVNVSDVLALFSLC